MLAAAENFWSFNNFDGGVCVGLIYAVVFVLMCDGNWRRRYNALVKKNNYLVEKIKDLEEKK